MDELGIWSKALSTQERTDPWNGGSGNTLGALPYIAGAPQQYRSDATTTIAAGGKTDETTVAFGAKVYAANSAGTARLQVEVEPAGVSFVNTSTTTSVATSSGNYITTSMDDLAAGSYHWQARAMDNTGATSTWELYGPASSSVDFIVDPPRSAYFDGSSAWKWPATNLGFNSTAPFTVELWYRNDSTSTVPTSTVQLLDTRTDGKNGFAISRSPSGINFSLNCGNTTTTVN